MPQMCLAVAGQTEKCQIRAYS